MTIDTTNLHLNNRKHLPSALRTLVEEYPRNIWEGHTNFDGLVKFWLERHLMFRKLVTMMRDDVEKREAKTLDPVQHAQRLARLGNMFVSELHMHHNIEDHQYFPVLQKLETSLVRGFEILDKDHHALDEHLEAFTSDANILIQDPIAENPKAVQEFHDGLGRLEGFLNRHLIDEEELVVPIILKNGFDQ